MDQADDREDLLDLVSLKMSDHVPPQLGRDFGITAGELSLVEFIHLHRPLGQYLHAAFADIRYAKLKDLADLLGGCGFSDGNKGHLRRLALRLIACARDSFSDFGQTGCKWRFPCHTRLLLDPHGSRHYKSDWGARIGTMMSESADRFQRAIERFDRENARDPNQKELLYAHRMTQWLDRLVPDASEPLKLAARCQHIRRWEIPRASFPMDRVGYLNWRKTLHRFHADVAGGILEEVGYDQATISRVRSLLQKERLKADPEMQALEDVICLVFLENYFSDFAREREEAKVLNILRRTWAKMSDRGRAMAMTLELSEADKVLLTKALAGSEAG